MRWTNDLELLVKLWPNAEAAAQWMIDYGDKMAMASLNIISARNKVCVIGWKDSWDGINHAMGELRAHPWRSAKYRATPTPPIARRAIWHAD